MRRAGETKMMRSDGYGRTRRYCISPVSPMTKRQSGTPEEGWNSHFGRRPGVFPTDPSTRMPMRFGHLHRESHHARALFVDIGYRLHAAAEQPLGRGNPWSVRSRSSAWSCIGYGTEIWPFHRVITFARTHSAFGATSWSGFLEVGHYRVFGIEPCPRGISQRSPVHGRLRLGRKRPLGHQGSIERFLGCRTKEPSSAGS